MVPPESAHKISEEPQDKLIKHMDSTLLEKMKELGMTSLVAIEVDVSDSDPREVPTSRKSVLNGVLYELQSRLKNLQDILGLEQISVVQTIDIEEEESMDVDDGYGVYEIVECDQEDTAGLYASGVKRFDEPTMAVEEPTKEINF